MKDPVLETCKKIIEASGPDKIFKTLNNNSRKNRAEKLKALEKEFQKIRDTLAVNSDGVQETILAKINEARNTLDEFYAWAKTKIADEEPTSDKETVDDPATTEPALSPQITEIQIKTKKRNYYLTEAIAEGDTSLIYKGYYLDDTSPVDVVLKVIKDPADNAFSKREAEALAFLYSEPNNEGRQLKHLPSLIDQFTTSDNQRGNIFSYFDGYNLTQVRTKYKNGVDRKHTVWMLNRLLSVAGYAHSRGVIHGNITPTNILIRPSDHNLQLIGWSCSIIDRIKNGARFNIFDQEFSAPEVEKRPVLPPMDQCPSQLEALCLEALPSADIYSIGKCMIYILGGDTKTNEMPEEVEAPLQRFLQGFVMESPLQRPRDAWEMYGELRKIMAQLWGKRKFLEFKM